MDWFIFILIGIALVTSTAFFLERKTMIRTGIFSAITILFGISLFFSGISFPSGWTIVTSGSTQTITQTFTTLTIQNNPFMLALAWGIIFMGLYSILEVITGLFSNFGKDVKVVKDKYGS